jgi:hypothetical protein
MDDMKFAKCHEWLCLALGCWIFFTSVQVLAKDSERDSLLVKLAAAPSWCFLRVDELATKGAELVKVCHEIHAELDAREARIFIQKYLELEGTHEGFGVSESKIYVFIRLALNVPEWGPMPTSYPFGPWVPDKNDKGDVNLLFPLKQKADGNFVLAHAWYAFQGEGCQCLQEFDYFLAKYGFRSSNATGAGISHASEGMQGAGKSGIIETKMLDESKAIQSLRESVIKARSMGDPVTSARATSQAYEKYFVYLGRSRLTRLLDDPDIGIALQAAWEVHRVVLKPQPGKAPWMLDEGNTTQFLKQAEKRIGFQPPRWWKEYVPQLYTHPNRGHGFPHQLEPEHAAAFVQDGQHVRVTAGAHTLTLLQNIPDQSPYSWRVSAAFANTNAFVAFYHGLANPYAFQAIDPVTMQSRWVANVWASRYNGGSGPTDCGHRVELVPFAGNVVVFGAEMFGIYIEAFDQQTGAVQYRFCSSYWDNHSENWKW